jgi:Rrf2 family protein
MAEATALPHPVVSKMLKTLAGAALLRSHRGAKGGYSLAREPDRLSVAEILEALEGPLALMECSAGPGHCEQESSCTVRAPWQRINRSVRGALEGMTLAELAGPRALLPIRGEAPAPRAAK